MRWKWESVISCFNFSFIHLIMDLFYNNQWWAVQVLLCEEWKMKFLILGTVYVYLLMQAVCKLMVTWANTVRSSWCINWWRNCSGLKNWLLVQWLKEASEASTDEEDEWSTKYHIHNQIKFAVSYGPKMCHELIIEFTTYHS